jgi:hypothetical protein
MRTRTSSSDASSLPKDRLACRTHTDPLGDVHVAILQRSPEAPQVNMHGRGPLSHLTPLFFFFLTSDGDSALMTTQEVRVITYFPTTRHAPSTSPA